MPETGTKQPASSPPLSNAWLPLGMLCALLAGALLVAKVPRGPRGAPASVPSAGPVLRVDGGAGAAGGALSITSVPTGATVMLNGRLVGATPLNLEGLPAGSYGVRLEKQGCQPCIRNLDLGAAENSVAEKLEPLPTGSAIVDVKPQGCEVLLDGELIGNTPLKTGEIPVGEHELLIRKTNCDPYVAQITVAPGEALSFSGFELKDKILAMMEGLVKSEPQRLLYYIDLGHYLFVNDRMDEAVSVFTQGTEVMNTPLDFNGPGYTGRDKMSDDEKELERRLRDEDKARFLKELEKHRSWPRKDTSVFRRKLEEGQQLLGQKNVKSWTWTEMAAQMAIKGGNTDKAARLYTDYIAAAGEKAPELPKAYSALIEAYLKQRDVPHARETFEKFYALCQNDEAALRTCGAAIYPYYERIIGTQARAQVLAMAERALKQSLTLIKDEAVKTQCLCDLGTVLSYAGRAKEAVPMFQQCIAATADPDQKEDRSLRLADALRKAERIEESEALYNSLKSSLRAAIRDAANLGLIYIAADKTKLRPPKGKR